MRTPALQYDRCVRELSYIPSVVRNACLLQCLLVLVLVVLAVASAQVLVSPGIYGVLPAVPAVVAPAQPGYVAATRGSVHVVPGNVPIASHHLNLAPAPGTL